MRRLAAWAAVLTLSIGSPSPALAYLKLGANVNGQIVDVTWRQQPIRYFVTDSGGPGVSAADLRAAIGRATATLAGGDLGHRPLRVCRRHLGAARRRGWTDDARLSRSSRTGSRARRDQLPDRHDQRRHRRGRCLLQQPLCLVDVGAGRGRSRGPRVGRPPRDRASPGTRSFGARRNRAHRLAAAGASSPAAP